jgi:hypothetical protein
MNEIENLNHKISFTKEQQETLIGKQILQNHKCQQKKINILKPLC